MDYGFLDDAFGAIVATLMADPQLGSIVHTWRRWSTDPKDDGSSGPVLAGLCPLVWLTPVASGAASIVGGNGTTRIVAVPMTIEVETWVAGKNPRRDALRLSALIWGALWPDDADARLALDDRFRAVGIVDVVPRNPILPGVFNDLLMGSLGTVELTQHIRL